MAWNLANFLKLGGMFSITRQYLLLEMFDVELKKFTNDNKYLICLFFSWVFNIYIYLLCHSDEKSEIRAKRGLKVFFLHM